jgi:GT2 family glycosyltransferase
LTRYAGVSKYVALINNDLAPEPNSLRQLVDHLERNPIVAGVQGKILTWDGRRIDSAGCYLSDIWYVLIRGRSVRDAANYPKAPVSYVDGAYSVYRAEAITKAGGLFIPDFFLYGDDYELAQRLWAAGYTLDYIPIVAGRHYGGASVDHSEKETVYFAHRGETGVIVLHDPFWYVKIVACVPRIFGLIIAHENFATRVIIDGFGLGLKLRRWSRFRDSACGPRVCFSRSDRLWQLLARLLRLPRGLDTLIA